MYIVRDKKSKKIIHINPTPPEFNLEGKEVYYQFNGKTMEIGKTGLRYVPEQFDINERGEIVDLSAQENPLNFQPLTEPLEIQRTLSQQIAEGLITLSPQDKLVGEGLDEKIVPKTLSEKVADSLITLQPEQKITGTGYDETIVPKTIKELIQDNIIKLSDIPAMIENNGIGLAPEELLADELITFDYYKKMKIDQFSEMSFDIRESFLPDYKIQNSLLGVYDEKMEADIKETVRAFRDEFYNLKKQVEEANDIKAIQAIKENYPKELINTGN